MKWEEIEYFLSSPHLTSPNGRGIEGISILDIWCWNGRFYWALLDYFQSASLPMGETEWGLQYLWIDLSSWLLEEAQKIYPWVNFQECNMLQLQDLFSSSWKGEVPEGGWGYIFFIASFHHLENIDDRLSVLQQAYDILKPGWTIYMTNWSLASEINEKKYKDCIIPSPDKRGLGWGIKYWSQDYSIKFWEYNRYYHWFSLEELEYLFTETWFEIIENREFDTRKNIISILKKPLR